MYEIRPNLLIGFHGCDASVCHDLINKPDKVKLSKEPFDWLGHGVYFWENNYDRALLWAKDKFKRGRIKEPAVVGAVLQLGHCCDFLDSKYVKILQKYHLSMVADYKANQLSLPENRDLPNDAYKDRILRDLDCAAIEYMHMLMRQERTMIFHPRVIQQSIHSIPPAAYSPKAGLHSAGQASSKRAISKSVSAT